MTDAPDIAIPAHLLPADGRFGAGPSKVRTQAVEALAAVAGTYLGTSHRQKTVKSVVGSLREGLAQLFSLPAGYEVALGNGGTTTFWDAATFGLIERRSQHLTFGEFSAKFATAAADAPHLDDPEIIASEVGTHPEAVARDDIDLYALTHNETSTGVMMQITRPSGAATPAAGGGLVAVDATSGAGGLRVDPEQFDAYYFAPQKCFGSDGGLWVALLSPAAQDRIAAVAATKRWVPASMDLTIALDNSRLDQTYNTPALATIFLFDNQVRWFNEQGGLEFSVGRSDKSSEILYTWAAHSDFATPFVAREQDRSHVIGTIDFDDSINAATVAAVLRSNGIVDTEP
ncbi:MAG TPA: phosphoserine transaminase, partial [Acidimicrobiales bacterium]|nr:phosphoserine transaminase [Acidimicrobiales bacterium]